MNTISYGKPDETWKDYGLFMNPVLHNGKETVYRAIIRKDQLISVVKGNYHLLPNEKALEAALAAADLTKMEPFAIRKHHNFLYNANATRLYAMFMPKGKNVYRVDGEEVLIGAVVQNSIDASSSFGCSLFSFRGICSNGSIIGRRNIANIYQVHTKGLAAIIQDLKNIILRVMEKGQDVINAYNTMAQVKITNELVEKLTRSRLPKRVLPDYLTNGELTSELAHVTEWQLYNDITRQIWHNMYTDIATKQVNFDNLHRIMPVVRGL